VLDRCREGTEVCLSHAAQFLRLVKAVHPKSGRDQLDKANRAVNMAIHYASDFALHGESDRWSAPLATFANRKGDCEDYAIAKFFALREAGFPEGDLQLVLVRIRQDHAVLAARHDDGWLLPDNRRSELMADSEASSYTPLYHRGVQLFAALYAERPQLEAEAAPAAPGDGMGRATAHLIWRFSFGSWATVISSASPCNY